MVKQFDILRKTRQYVLELISQLTLDQLNEVPAGFSNNIMWNLGHMLASQQGVCYLRGGLPLIINEKYFLTYKPDSKPGDSVSQAYLDEVKTLFISTIDQMELDYNNNLFANNPSWINSYGVEHKNINDTINFLLFHEGLHLGYIMALKRLVSR